MSSPDDLILELEKLRVETITGRVLVDDVNVTLKRGINGYLQLYTWWKSARDGNVQRSDVTIKLLDEQKQGLRDARGGAGT